MRASCSRHAPVLQSKKYTNGQIKDAYFSNTYYNIKHQDPTFNKISVV
jgi:hypothetical protein